MVLVKTTCMVGANAVVVMFSTVAQGWVEFQVNRLIKCMGEWEAAKDQGSSGQNTLRASLSRQKELV